VVTSVLACMVVLVASASADSSVAEEAVECARVACSFIKSFFLLGRYQIDQLRCTRLRDEIVIAVVVMGEKRR